jgi:FtsZ-binding cell division protein ZapB
MAESSLLSLDECMEIIRSIDINARKRISKNEFVQIIDSVNAAIAIPHSELGPNAENAPKLVKIMEGLKVAVSFLFDETEELKKKVHNLEKEVDNLKKEVERLKKLEDELLVGQIAAKVEQEIVNRLLEGTNASSSFLTINRLINICDKGISSRQQIFTKQEEIDAVNRNWDDLQTKIGLDDDVYGAIEKFKSGRNREAHPNLTIKQVQDRLKTCTYSPANKAMIDRLVKILQELSVTNIGTFN